MSEMGCVGSENIKIGGSFAFLGLFLERGFAAGFSACGKRTV